MKQPVARSKYKELDWQALDALPVTSQRPVIGGPDSPRPIPDEYLTFLDDLRESGDTNMFGAAPYLQAAFPDLRRTRHNRFAEDDDATIILRYWMRTFGNADR